MLSCCMTKSQSRQASFTFGRLADAFTPKRLPREAGNNQKHTITVRAVLYKCTVRRDRFRAAVRIIGVVLGLSVPLTPALSLILHLKGSVLICVKIEINHDLLLCSPLPSSFARSEIGTVDDHLTSALFQRSVRPLP